MSQKAGQGRFVTQNAQKQKPIIGLNSDMVCDKTVRAILGMIEKGGAELGNPGNAAVVSLTDNLVY